MLNTFSGIASHFVIFVNTVGIELIGNSKINKPGSGACLYYMKRLIIAIVAQDGVHPNILGVDLVGE
jgi:hypothetical protein